MSENFSELLQESFNHFDVAPNSIIQGVVLDIDDKWITVHAGLKSEGLIPREQFLNTNGEIEVAIGDNVKIALIAIENGNGQTLVSRELARRLETWANLEESFEKEEVVTGIVVNKVKGGFAVDLNNVKAFLPGSLADSSYSRETDFLLGKTCDLKIIKIDQQRNNIVVSRRATMQAVDAEQREVMMAQFEPGKVVKGVVKNITEYGAFVDLGVIDGLLHINDMSWKRVDDPSSIVSLGQEIEVSVVSVDREKNRISLSIKQLEQDPWAEVINNYKVGEKYQARVAKIVDYGCFVELKGGIEGLVHASEMSWVDKSPRPASIVKIDSNIEVVVLDVDVEARRISLGIKQCLTNPWSSFAETYKVGEKVSGNIVSITDFGIFVGLEGGANALIRTGDINWNEEGGSGKLMQQYKKGDEIEAVILSIDPNNERIALGVKQLNSDSFSDYIVTNKRGSVVTGKISDVSEKSISLDLAEGVIGSMRSTEMSSTDKIVDARNKFRVGDEVTAKIITVSKAQRQLVLSIKALELADEKMAIATHRKQSQEDSNSTSLGDLIKAQMNQSE